MAVVTLQELIAKRENIKDKRKLKYEISTSIGDVVAVLPDAALVAEALDMATSFETNKYIVYNSIIEPNLKNEELQKVYGVLEPVEIVTAIFLPGELTRIANKLFELAGFKGKLVAKVHDEVKNA